MILKNAVAAHLRRCMKFEMALPFHRLMRLAPGLHLRFCSTHVVRWQATENGTIIQENSKTPVSTAFPRMMPTLGLRALRAPLLMVFGALLPAFDLEPETHAFVSFGWLDTNRNQWLGNSTSGSSEFWEAAANATIHPLPQVTLGGQLFARDFQRYDNGRAQLDWLFAEWRPADACGIQGGRIKLPFGLYNESRDVDAARATVFLPIAIYPLRTRDLFGSTDGGKIFGLMHLGPVGSIEYAAYIGHTELSENGGFATYLADLGLGSVDQVSMKRAWGGMLQWNTPLTGLATRITLTNLEDLEAIASGPGGTRLTSTTDGYRLAVGSMQWEHPLLTLVGEAQAIHGATALTIADANGTVLVPESTAHDRSGGAYLSATWHLPADIDGTLAVERSWTDLRDLHLPQTTRWVAGLRWGISEHWSVKAEYQHIVGTAEATTADNPDGIRTPWDVIALKTTVDF
jgi:hypothetical protein